MTDSEHFNAFYEKFKKLILDSGKVIVKKYTNELYDEARHNVSIGYHSPIEYKLMDHPFAVRHGSIQPHGHVPLWSVHNKNGQVVKGLSRWFENNKNEFIGIVGWKKPNMVTIYVLHGTIKMHERDILKLTALQIKLVERINKEMNYLGNIITRQ